ncbi:hypothetical protein ACXZ66_14095 (plasmid) [Corynebacterium sp. S7]|uniref:hypothetical protein n=1 Tax=Corynebacterium lubricantis TaxID=541095 RepID=UPI000363206E|nr:hypothetical protein [Corynebacterium lubricantis]
MGIGNAAKKAEASARKKVGTKEKAEVSAPLTGFEERSATLRIYVKDKALLKEAKLAALEDDTSLSQLWEEWAMEWLKNRKN